MTFSPKQKIYLTGGAFIAASIAIFVAVIFPLLVKIQTDSQMLSEQKAASESFYQKWKNIGSLKKQYEQIGTELNNQAGFLIKNDVLNFFTATENTARVTGNRQEISIADDSQNNATSTLQLRISLYGSFPDLLKFLIGMENAPYFNDVSSLQIIRLADEKNTGYKSGEINTIINLNAYYQ